MNWRKFWEKNVVSIAIILSNTEYYRELLFVKLTLSKNGMFWMTFVC